MEDKPTENKIEEGNGKTKEFEHKRYKSIWIISTAVIAILLIISILTNGFNLKSVTGAAILSQEEVEQKVKDYIETYLLRPDTEFEITNIEKENGLYKLELKVGLQTMDSYATKDGKLLFPTAIDLTKTPELAETAETQPKKTCDDIKKQDKPDLQIFVVSYCPFGTQAQRVLSPISEILGDYIKVRYIGDVVDGKVTAMHGEKEATENLRQICIREEQSTKFWDYINCFIKKGETDNCLSSVKIDEKKLETCMGGKGVDYAKEDFELAKKYKVTGSPTLILNGERVSEFDFGGRSAEAVKTLLCCGFNQQPNACLTGLNEDQAARGFSETYAASSDTTSSGSC